MLTIDVKLDPRFDYCGTLFDGLQVKASEGPPAGDSVRDDFARMLDEAVGVAASHRAMVHRTYRFSDRRYNPITHSWPLTVLIERLERVLSFGPLAETPTEEHEAFSIRRSRPEDAVVRVEHGAVRLNEWFAEPVYYLGKFDSVSPALEALKAIQSYLEQLWAGQ